MNIERFLRLIAGALVMLTVTLGYYVHPYWLLFTGFIGANLFQSAFTNWCPMMTLLRKLGVRGYPEPSMTPTHALRDCGHCSNGPKAVADQSSARILAPISPPPANTDSINCVLMRSMAESLDSATARRTRLTEYRSIVARHGHAIVRGSQ